MTRTLDRNDRLSLGVLALAALVTAAIYGELPEPMPIHWGIRGEVDGWAPRAVGAWLLLAVGLGTWALTRFLPFMMRKEKRAKLAGAPVSAVGCLLALFFASFQVLGLYAALNPGFTVARGASILLGALWIALGQLLPRLRRNPMFGVRTSSALASEDNWRRTQRVASCTYGIGGAVSILAGLFAGGLALPVTIAAAFVSALVPTVYSYVIARR